MGPDTWQLNDLNISMKRSEEMGKEQEKCLKVLACNEQESTGCNLTAEKKILSYNRPLIYIH